MRRGRAIVKLMSLNGLAKMIRTGPDGNVHCITLMTRPRSQAKLTDQKKKTDGKREYTSTSQPITGTLTTGRGATT